MATELAYDVVAQPIRATTERQMASRWSPSLAHCSSSSLLHFIGAWPAADQPRSIRLTSSGSRSFLRALRRDGEHLRSLPQPVVWTIHVEGVRDKGTFGY